MLSFSIEANNHIPSNPPPSSHFCTISHTELGPIGASTSPTTIAGGSLEPEPRLRHRSPMPSFNHFTPLLPARCGQFEWKPDACCAKPFTTVFSSLETCCTVKSLKRAIISRHFSIYTFKESSKHWKVLTICCMTDNESPNASTCFTPMELRICSPNKMASYSA
jgi:hypothetical protein